MKLFIAQLNTERAFLVIASCLEEAASLASAQCQKGDQLRVQEVLGNCLEINAGFGGITFQQYQVSYKTEATPEERRAEWEKSFDRISTDPQAA